MKNKNNRINFYILILILLIPVIFILLYVPNNPINVNLPLNKRHENFNVGISNWSGWPNVTIIPEYIGESFSIATDNDENIHIVWRKDTGYPDYDFDIFYLCYNDSGWSDPIMVSDNYGWNDGDSWNPSITTDNNGNIHVVWSDETVGEWGGGISDREIMYANYSGSGWSNATVISDDSTGWNDGNSFGPSIATDKNGDIHVVWRDCTFGEWGTDNEIMYANYSAGVWSNATVISDDSTGWNDGNSFSPSITTDENGNIHVVWRDDTNGEWGTDEEIMYTNCTTAGWSNATVISDVFGWNDGDSLNPCIATDLNGYVHVAWQDYTVGEWTNSIYDTEIMYANYTATGWSNATVISDDYTGWNKNYSWRPSIAVDNNGIVHVIWEDWQYGIGSPEFPDSEIMYTNYTAAGWSNATIISDDYTGWNDGASWNPSIAMDNNSVLHVIWQDETDGEWGTSEVSMYSVNNDIYNPNLLSVSRYPMVPNNLNTVNITVHSADNLKIDTVIINSNHTGTSADYVMDFVSGYKNDGYWDYIIPTLPAGATITYTIWVNDSSNNSDINGPYQYTVIDGESPDIVSVSREPINPNNLDSVNITVHITENVGIGVVLLTSNHSGIPYNYSMNHLSGTLQDGYWNYTIPAVPTGTIISYSIWANDTSNIPNTEGPYQYTVGDSEGPNIVSVLREPTNPNNLDSVNITAHITDNIGVHVVFLTSNHSGTPYNYSMNHLSGTLQDGYWNYTIPPVAVGTSVSYSIWGNDTYGNYDTNGSYQYIIVDGESPDIISVSRDPTNPNNLNLVNITAHITDNIGIHVVFLTSNHSGTPYNYSMNHLSGTLQNGYWNYTIPALSVGTTISYSVWVNDTSNIPNIDGPYQYNVRDGENPNIISVSRVPMQPTNQDNVTIYVHIQDNVGVETVLININHTGTYQYIEMTFFNGTLQNGYWSYTVPRYGKGITINYSIWTNDSNNNNVSSTIYGYVIIETEEPIEPSIIIVLAFSSEDNIIIFLSSPMSIIIIIGAIAAVSTISIVVKFRKEPEELGLTDKNLNTKLKKLAKIKNPLDTIKDERIKNYFKREFNILSIDEINTIIKIDIPKSEKIELLKELASLSTNKRNEFIEMLKRIKDNE